jgi:hypothetical protein
MTKQQDRHVRLTGKAQGGGDTHKSEEWGRSGAGLIGNSGHFILI